MFPMTAPRNALSLKRWMTQSLGKRGASDSREQPQAAPDTPTHHPHVPPSSLSRPGLASCLRRQESPLVDAS